MITRDSYRRYADEPMQLTGSRVIGGKAKRVIVQAKSGHAIEEILGGKTVQMPQTLERTFKPAEKIGTEGSDQGQLEF